jgi:GDPmannose 4,6-dehydratase
MKKALITGINGQDGSYLAELLLEKDYDVYGTIRRNSIEKHEYSRVEHIKDKITLKHVNTTDTIAVEDFVKEVLPDEVYHLAAMSQVGISFIEPMYTLSSVLLSSINVFAVKQFCPEAKYYQASSSEIYGNQISKQSLNEDSVKNPISPYGIAKLAAYHFVREYRNSFGIFASNGILFNHESPRRGETFVTQKVVQSAYRIANGEQEILELGNPDSKRDWGHAKDYVKAMWMILQHDKPDDFVCATGKVHSIRELCEYVFSSFGLNYRRYVKFNVSEFNRPEDLLYLQGDSSKVRKEIGWRPEYLYTELLDDMINDVREKGEIT